MWVYFSFFPAKHNTLQKRKTLQRQSFSRIHFKASFKIHIHLPYPITGSKQKGLAYFGGLKTSREKLRPFKTTFFDATHLPVEELELVPLALSSHLWVQKVRSGSSNHRQHERFSYISVKCNLISVSVSSVLWLSTLLLLEFLPKPTAKLLIFPD